MAQTSAPAFAALCAILTSGSTRMRIEWTPHRIVPGSTPSDTSGVVPNRTMTWGVVVKNGLAYVNDMITGLWVVRIDPRRVVP